MPCILSKLPAKPGDNSGVLCTHVVTLLCTHVATIWLWDNLLMDMPASHSTNLPEVCVCVCVVCVYVFVFVLLYVCRNLARRQRRWRTWRNVPQMKRCWNCTVCTNRALLGTATLVGCHLTQTLLQYSFSLAFSPVVLSRKSTTASNLFCKVLLADDTSQLASCWNKWYNIMLFWKENTGAVHLWPLLLTWQFLLKLVKMNDDFQ